MNYNRSFLRLKRRFKYYHKDLAKIEWWHWLILFAALGFIRLILNT